MTGPLEPTAADVTVSVSSVVTTRVVEVELGPAWRAHRVTARGGDGDPLRLVPRGATVRGRLPRAGPPRVTSVVVLGVEEAADDRHRRHAARCPRADRADRADHASCGYPPPPTRQRTFTSLATAPAWVAALADAALAAAARDEEDT